MKFLDHIANPRRLSCPIWKLISKEVKTEEISGFRAVHVNIVGTVFSTGLDHRGRVLAIWAYAVDDNLRFAGQILQFSVIELNRENFYAKLASNLWKIVQSNRLGGCRQPSLPYLEPCGHRYT